MLYRRFIYVFVGLAGSCLTATPNDSRGSSGLNAQNLQSTIYNPGKVENHKKDGDDSLDTLGRLGPFAPESGEKNKKPDEQVGDYGEDGGEKDGLNVKSEKLELETPSQIPDWLSVDKIFDLFKLFFERVERFGDNEFKRSDEYRDMKLAFDKIDPKKVTCADLLSYLDPSINVDSSANHLNSNQTTFVTMIHEQRTEAKQWLDAWRSVEARKGLDKFESLGRGFIDAQLCTWACCYCYTILHCYCLSYGSNSDLVTTLKASLDELKSCSEQINQIFKPVGSNKKLHKRLEELEKAVRPDLDPLESGFFDAGSEDENLKNVVEYEDNELSDDLKGFCKMLDRDLTKISNPKKEKLLECFYTYAEEKIKTLQGMNNEELDKILEMYGPLSDFYERIATSSVENNVQDGIVTIFKRHIKDVFSMSREKRLYWINSPFQGVPLCREKLIGDSNQGVYCYLFFLKNCLSVFGQLPDKK